ncbi:MAG: biotin--[acetyl-CoA-carboxylase] ligase [Streptosporangiales bacterium]|nr:biotin--[acetyl-CoA-carboxylase] ligase [Streptosporangiales bacterium]
MRSSPLWREVRVVAETASTNADVAAAARQGEPEGLVVVADHQSAGRGRLDRSWVAPPGTALMFSALLRPAEVPLARWSCLPLLAGVAVATATRETCGVDATLKWPNDVLVGERKLAGLLTERVGDAAVLGVGLNVTTTAEELPTPAATSLLVEGATSADRERLLDAVLDALEHRYASWRRPGGEVATLYAYRELCATIGRSVRVLLPGDRVLDGVATDVGATGALVVRTLDGTVRELAAGDVVHVRPAE